MKYMGSKQNLLRNGLGDLIIDRSRSAHRIVDLFSGAGAVSWFAAEETRVPVLAVDLQQYSQALAESVLLRTKAVDHRDLFASWLERAQRRMRRSRLWSAAKSLDLDPLTPAKVGNAREICSVPSSVGPVWNAYGGYYYSPAQAIAFDYLRAALPEEAALRSASLGALVIAASRCAAAPGHTAQPFRPTPTALTYIEQAWRKDPFDIVKAALPDIARRRAQVRGRARVADALEVARSLTPSDLVVVDPPYSAAQYSRFYHVLETIARGVCGPVEGAGRYPPLEERPQSDFSKRSTSRRAVHDLLATLGGIGTSVIMTFPQHGASNGLGGEELVAIAGKWFRVDVTLADTRFSTLGGNGRQRASRRRGSELVLSLAPRRR